MSMSTAALFCILDDFAKTYADWEGHHLVPTDRQRRRMAGLSP